MQLFVTGEPCLMCLGAAVSFFLGEIYHGHEMPSDGAVALVQQLRRRWEDFPAYRVPRIEGGILRTEGRHRPVSGICRTSHVGRHVGVGQDHRRSVTWLPPDRSREPAPEGALVPASRSSPIDLSHGI